MTDGIKTMTAEDLAPILQRSVRTIKADVIRRPETLPPSIKIPGSKCRFWLEADVKAWLEKCRVVTRHKIR